MFESDYLVPPGKKFKLKDRTTNDTGPFKDKAEAEPVIQKNKDKIHELQEVLYAEGKHALLIVFQAIDAGGKDGAIDYIFSGVNPQGCSVTSFKAPSSAERAHDFLWRHHLAVPALGMIGIHNRSHYEAVLVERVKDIVPKKVWSARYEHINTFEHMLADEGVTILKFFLHISKDEQKRRLEARLRRPEKHWKFSTGDLAERARWDDYQEAFQDAINETSTDLAPWYVVPANHKWYRNLVIARTIAATLEQMNPQFPESEPGLDSIVVT